MNKRWTTERRQLANVKKSLRAVHRAATEAEVQLKKAIDGLRASNRVYKPKGGTK